MDVVTLGAAKSAAKKYTDQVAQSLRGGVRYQGEVNYYSDLPNDAEPGDSYTVKYSGTSGTDPDGTEYTWGLNHQTQQYTWIDFSKDSYTKIETNNLLSTKQDVADATHATDISEQEYNQLPASKNNDDVIYFVYNGEFDPISADDVDDTNSTNKFATAAQLAQIATNTTNIGTLNTFKENTYLEKWNYATQCESIQDNTYITDIASYYIDNEAPYFVLNYVPIPEGAATVYVDCEGFKDKTLISYGFIWFKENKSVCSGADSHGIATSKTLTVPAQARYLAITFEYVNDDYTNKPKGYYYVTDKTVSERMDKVVINNESINVLSAEDTTEALNSKQATIDSTHKLSSDLVDDTNATNQFVTAAEKTKISKAVTTDDIGLGTDYFVYNGIRVYVSATEPTDTIPDGSIWIGG